MLKYGRMLFHSFEFLFLFLPVFFLVYGIVLRSRGARLTAFLAASYYFYARWNVRLLSLIIVSTLIDYWAGLSIEATESGAKKRRILAISLITNLGLLGFFKYTNFLLEASEGLAGLFGASWKAPHYNIILPVGISFYTFQSMSYTIDVYRGTLRATRSLRDFALFVACFPQLIAGPIVRARDLLPQFSRLPEVDVARVRFGALIFLMGLVKKVIIADHLSVFSDAFFAAPGTYGSGAAWIGVLAYTGQIYCDFSGYSDMAIGLGHIFGLRIPVNFRTPYLARSCAEFWRRWHISLSTWLRDYLYAPLRGARKSKTRVYAAMLGTMLLGGLWHGADWTFLVWGAYHGALLMGHRFLSRNFGRPLDAAAGLLPPWFKAVTARMTVFILAVIGWVFFRAAGLDHASLILCRMWTPTTGRMLSGLGAFGGAWGLILLHDSIAFFAERHGFDFERASLRLPAATRFLAYTAAILLLIAFTPLGLSPFVYFQF